MEQAKGELVPGGLAMVYGLVVDVDLNGKSCTTEAPANPDEVANGEWEAGDWLCDLDGAVYVFNRSNLMPINPEADPLETTQDRELCLTQ